MTLRSYYSGTSPSSVLGGSISKSLYGTKSSSGLYGLKGISGGGGGGGGAKEKNYDYDIDTALKNSNGEQVSNGDLDASFAEGGASVVAAASSDDISPSEEKTVDCYWKLSSNSPKYDEIPIKIRSANQSNRSRIIQHPVEDGTVRMDNKVVEPISLSIRGLVKIGDVGTVSSILESCRQSKDLGSSIVLSSPLTSIQLWVVSYTKSASDDKVDVFDFDIQLQEILFSRSMTATMANEDYSSPK